MRTYAEDFSPGNKVRIVGTPSHGEEGVVMDLDTLTEPYVDKSRNGYIPVFLPRYQATKMWWFAPVNLKRIDMTRKQDTVHVKNEKLEDVRVIAVAMMNLSGDLPEVKVSVVKAEITGKEEKAVLTESMVADVALKMLEGW